MATPNPVSFSPSGERSRNVPRDSCHPLAKNIPPAGCPKHRPGPPLSHHHSESCPVLAPSCLATPRYLPTASPQTPPAPHKTLIVSPYKILCPTTVHVQMMRNPFQTHD
ncbi:hypothetical protein E2C01_016414 [Portunus trituberculatus]|uniref:Uncharacterized protein n=1 Tax=Portunus trituberculatus TaxID=210409 RepID=A0A5B7DNZ8_PORTR|nr:hypothetical protein [Portunus trituberculatus]